MRGGWDLQFGLFVPGSSLLHRLSTRTKLVAMVVISVAAVVWRTPATTATLLVGVVVVTLAAGVGLRPVGATLVRLAPLIVLLGGWQAWQRGWEVSFTVVGNIVGLVLLATLFTAVTPIDAMLDEVTRLARPLRRVGLEPQHVGLAFSLLVRWIPLTMQTARQSHEAAQARGLDRSLRAHLTPLVLRSVAQARATGDALHARGLVDVEDS